MVEVHDIVIVQRACFARNSAEIEGDAALIVEATARTLQDFPRLRSLAIIGNATPRERRPQGLAQRRAEALRERLVALGVSAERLVVESAGISRPLNVDPESAQNRCVLMEVRAMDEDPPPSLPPPPPHVLCPPGTRIPEPVDACARQAEAD